MSVHCFDTDVAAMVGPTAATLAYNIQHWCEKNAANGVHRHDDRHWTYNTVKAFVEMFPYLSAKQIRTALDKLESTGLIVSGNYNKQGRDQTKWYSFVPEAVVIAANCPKGQMQLPKKATPIAQKGKPLPDINTNINLEDKSSKSSDVQIAFDGFCKVAERLKAQNGGETVWPIPSKLTQARRAALRSRLKEHSLADWGTVLRKAAASQYCTGQVNGFKAHIDFLSSPSGFIKTLEGNYDDRTQTGGAAGGGSNFGTRNAKGNGRSTSAFDRLIDRVAESASGPEPARYDGSRDGEGDVIDVAPTRLAG